MRLVVASLCLVACSKSQPPAPSQHAPKAPAAAAPVAPQAPAVAKTLDPGTDLTALAERMHYEAAHRPAAKINADAVLDALDASGMQLRKRRQYLATTMHASYCAGGTTADGIAISVCEYASPAAAAAGKSFADHQYAAIEARRVVQGQTLLTIARANPQVAERAIHTFNAL